MRVAVSASENGLDAPASPIFGRCATIVFIDTDTLAVNDSQNPAVGAAGGAGVQAAQWVIQEGAEAVITGNVGPKALQVFQAAGIPVYVFGTGTVRQAIAALLAGKLEPATRPTARAHAGMSGVQAGRGRGGSGRGGGGGRGGMG